ncbi:cysteine hydrolase family protein [Sulfoacidibacillus thermotolerans]|uniref:Isochorismatase-like domain-containing protein n=1 Tax=Sulfoacidibacillus thermotolerans TaxID=1765684 RepID=A0A2U3DBT8_SULT2|nr:isochorismatase family cysteine hydrolase [Sulfoacidibacillus thermotolerans]PWI58747.1 hypothetical protein BM613_01225 [Sulfoacidibacillus thermotolerans]
MQRALLVIDMTYDFIADDGALPCGEAGQKIVNPILQAVQTAHQNGDFVIFACDAHAIDDKEFQLWPVHCVAGTKGAQLIEPLNQFYATYESDQVRYLPKTKYDAFFETPLAMWLQEKGVQEVLVCGVCTSICCYATALGAYYRGYQVVIDPALMADLTPEAHEFAVLQMENVLKAQRLSN